MKSTLTRVAAPIVTPLVSTGLVAAGLVAIGLVVAWAAVPLPAQDRKPKDGKQEVGKQEEGAPAAKQPSGEWIQLFNGKDLDGWKVKITGHELGDNFENTFRVEDGLLKVSYDGYTDFAGKFGHLFHDHEFSNYVMRVEYRFVGPQVPGGPGWALRNSGVMIHGQKPETMDKDQKFPVSIEVQLLGGSGSGDRPTANLCTPGTHVEMDGKLVTRHCTSSNSKTYHGDQWVTVEIEVRGNQVIKHKIDDQVVLQYEHPQLDEGDADAKKVIQAAGGKKMLSGGTISLQSESHPVEFRKVELRKLDD